MRIGVLLLLSVLLAGCSHHAPPPDARLSDSITVIAELNDQLNNWHGTPYRYGGMSRSGVDCSGFVWRTLKDRFNLPMDRVTTGDLLHMGVRVSKQQLRPGDLVFFRIHGGMHVGFYDTDHNFLHASASQGVMRSSLDNPYWNRVFYQARRLPKEYNAQVTMNNDDLHLAKNR